MFNWLVIRLIFDLVNHFVNNWCLVHLIIDFGCNFNPWLIGMIIFYLIHV